MQAVIGVTEAAKRLGVTGETVRDWARRGRLPAFKIGKSWLFHVPEIERRIAEAQSGGEENNDKEIVDFVREHIGTIELALLVLSHLQNLRDHSQLDRAFIAELANQLREIVDARAD